MLNKRGQGLETGTIILIILGILVLVVLVLGFTMGWSTILPFIVPPNNVNTIVNNCQASCSTGDMYGYCAMERTLKAPDLPTGKKEVKGNCTYFSAAEGYAKYGVMSCPSLCPVPETPEIIP